MQSRTSFKVTLGCVLFILHYLQGWKFHNLSMQNLTTLTVTTFSFSIWSEFLLCLLTSILCCAYLRSLLYIYLLGICRQQKGLSSLLFSHWTDSAPSACPCVSCSSLCSSLCLLWLCAAGFTPAHSDFVLWKPQLETILELQSHNCWIEGKIPFSWFAVCAFANTAQFTIDVCQVGTTLVVATTGSCAAWCLWESSGPFLQSRFLASFHQSVLVCGVQDFVELLCSTCWGPS